MPRVKGMMKDPTTGEYVPRVPATSEEPPAVRPQIRDMAGLGSPEELPDSTASVAEDKPRRVRKPRISEPETDPLMEDPKYRKAIQGMVGFGSPRLVKTPFSLVAKAMHKPEMALQAEEEERIDGYFYVVSKRTNLDPTRSPWMLTLYGVVMLLELVLTRVWMYNQQSFANKAMELFGFKLGDDEAKENEEGEDVTI